MRVAIDATPLLVRSAGVKNYLYYWIEHLRRLAGDDAIRTIPRLDASRPLNHDASAASPLRTFLGLGALALSNYTPLPMLDWAARGCDIFHATNLVRRPPRRPRLTSTIHDMTSWMMPELHSAATRRADAATADLLRRAHRLIAVSESTKRDAVRILRIPPERITVIYSGIPRAFFECDAGGDRRGARTIRAQTSICFRTGDHRAAQEHPHVARRFQSVAALATRAFRTGARRPNGVGGSRYCRAGSQHRIRALSGVHSRTGFGAAHRGRGHLRLSIALRRIWISFGAGHGGWSAIRDFQHFLSARNRGRCCAVDRPAQRHRASRCFGTAHALTRPSQRTCR